MEENKTGVWIRCANGREIRYNHDWHSLFDVGDVVEVDNGDVYARFKIEIAELKNISKVIATYIIKPQFSIDRTRHPHKTISFHGAAEPIEMDVYANDKVLVIVPPWYKKEQYRNQSIRSTEASITVTRKEVAETMNENLDMKTGTIPADTIKVDTLNVSVPEPTTELGQALKKIVDRMANVTIADLGERNIEFKEKEMYTKSLKEMIKKPIYVNKEITVKEPMLDNNGKQIEKDGKPVFKTKHYHGMVKILWNCGAETVAYVEGNDVYDRENGFKTCVIKYLFGNAGAHDAVDFWTNKYVKYPSSCIEVTENLCKLEEILEKDKYRKDDQKGLPHAKFLRRTTVDCIVEFSSDKVHYTPSDSKLANEFKKLAKKYFPELKGKEIYINDNKNVEVFVAIK